MCRSRALSTFLRSSPQPNWTHGDVSNKSLTGARRTFDFARMSSKETYQLLTSSIVPRPIALVSTLSDTNVPNLAPFSYFQMAGHNPPLVTLSFSLSPKRRKDTRDNILSTRQFTVNVVSEWLAEAANATSVEAPSEVDEWILAGLTPKQSTLVKPPLVAESAVSLECELYFHKDLPFDAEATTTLVVGDVKLAHVHHSVLDDAGTQVEPDKLNAVARMGGRIYARVDNGFMEMSDQREQRLLAVAKLKRAASLPRMKDGRRPPMHPEAMSEGERANTDDERREDVDTPSPEPPPPAPDIDEDATITRRPKRRSRSRGSRGSKDLKAKARAGFSPAPSPIVPSDSSQDESPVPTTLATLLMRSPTPTTPGTRPQTPNTPLPSLEDLQRGLFRSNSVGSTSASRIMAMHKLTGGQEAYDPSPPPCDPSASRQTWPQQHPSKEPEGEPPSEEIAVIAASPSPTPGKRKRIRHRRRSSNANTNPAISDSELVSTSPNTPIVPSAPLPMTTDLVAETSQVFSSPSRAASPRGRAPSPWSRAASPRSPSVNEQIPLPIAEPSPLPPILPPGLSLPSSSRASPAESERPRRRSVVVEDEDEERPTLQVWQPPPPFMYDYSTPPVSAQSDLLYENAGASPAPVAGPPSRQPTPDYPPRISPFTTPLQEKPAREEEDEEEFLYAAETYDDGGFERQISWIASPVPEIRMPIDDDDGDEDEVMDEDEEYEQRPPSAHSSADSSPQEAYDDTSPRQSFQSKGVMVESETSPEIVPTQMPPSPSSVTALSQSVSMVRTASDDSTSPQTYPTRLSVASRTQDRSPLTAEFEWEEGKRNWEGGSPSTWDKVKTAFRSGSASGRRSRTNSIVTRDRRDNTDSSVSRESGVSLTGSKGDKGETSTIATVQPMMQTSSASASAVSLSPPIVSPFPMASPVDLAKYQNAKLFPFPGMKKLEEQRIRAKGMLHPSTSTPDIATLYNGYETDPTQASVGSYTPSQTPDMTRERKLSHQASDTRLLDKYAASPPGTSTPSSPANIEYFSVTPLSSISPSSSGSKLPMTLPGVKQWLSSRKKSSQTAPSSMIPQPELGKASPGASKKPSLSDLILRKDTLGLGKDWEDTDVVSHEPPTTKPTNVAPDPLRSTPVRVPPPLQDVERTFKAAHPSEEHHSDPPPALPSPPDPLSPTPDVSSSLSDYPAPSTSASSSATSSRYSLGNPVGSGPQGPFVLERLEENLSRGARSPMWASVIDEPPRRLVLSSEVLQVVNANTVKDRCLFLFTDILVIAKPLVMEQDNIIESYNPHMMGRKYTDRRYLVKNVVLMSQLRFNAERDEVPPKSTNYFVAPRNPLIRSFVHQFSRDPDHAISTLLSKSSTPDDPTILGQLLFKTLDLDRARLGDYLSRRTSKVVLKAYVDNFGFVGVRVDSALRAFLLSLNIPPKSAYNPNPIEYLLDSFAGRWYEANAKIVVFDKDLAIRLVRALVQLNDFLHGGIAQEPGPTEQPQRGINARDFANAFRQYDPRNLVPDDLLEDVFHSVRAERLSQARASSVATDIQIVLKRPLPPRLTYRVQSEPIILRISQADPNLTIHLCGQDLEFDPPVLTFARSPEASFRVTGRSLGSKTMIMCRSGPNALRYSGLPLSNSLVVERAFMRNTFEMAFLNHDGVKRRYMFSIDDPIKRHEWVSALKRHIDSASSSVSSVSLSQTSHGTSKFHRAAEIVAFKALQQTLMGSPAQSGASPAAIRSALQRLNSNGSSRPLNGGLFRFPDPDNSVAKATYHVRSKSRSRVYHRQGAGQNETELNDPDDQPDPDVPSQHEGPLWSSEELQLQCRQNSSIPAVLAFLQVGYPEQGRI
ncbi:SEC7 domain-containing protein [Mycena kentingensis (nom. inval.)]|nr:SEC7 domain-containing protein [Mycena kentingensis (nom. inval.)]